MCTKCLHLKPSLLRNVLVHLQVVRGQSATPALLNGKHGLMFPNGQNVHIKHV